MDCRAAAHAVTQVATLLELHGGDGLTVKSLLSAARLVAALDSVPLTESLDRGLIAADALSPAAMSLLRELADTNSSAQLEQLQEETPEGLLEMLRIPGLGPARIRAIHEGLAIDTIPDLEAAARDGRLAALPKFGAKTAERVLKGIAGLHEAGASMLWPHARAEAARFADALRAHGDVLRLEIAGPIRRHMEVVRDVDLVAAIDGAPGALAATLESMRSVRDVRGSGGLFTIRLDNGVQVNLSCARPEHFAIALWQATGSAAHVQQVVDRATSMGFVLTGTELRGADGATIAIPDEPALYRLLGLAYVVPEQREATGEVEQAAGSGFAPLLQRSELRGALHCHSRYSDGGATIEDMAEAARAHGLTYLGVSDHSQSNTYAGGLSREAILQQHGEIDALNQRYAADGIDFRLLKGIEADILPCGRVDYDAGFLDRFDFVIGSVHTRYGMNVQQMTERVLKALDDPHLTILGHPTGRLLLTREPYAIDLAAVIEKAGAVGVAVELNADPHRLDIDWHACRIAQSKGTLVSIGPDAHSPAGFENLEFGVAVARKGWLGASNVLNTRTADEVMAFAQARRTG